MMKRDEALKVLAERYPEGIVVPVFQSAFDWMGIRPHPLNYVCTGAMGQASSHALGLALARPDKMVAILDGDGSLLMNLGGLVTAANLAPKNLVHFVSFNKIYEVNGRYPIPAADQIDFSGIAKAAGYPRTFTFSNLAAFADAIDEILDGSMLTFVTLEVKEGEMYPRDFTKLHSADAREAFRNAIRQN
jgi:phosphonopyruvate decarboxylase|tara:strand:+ start:1144 stop:1710 length:567 start_codon:yes stop_codon:yes gene_type:complete